MKNTLLVLFVVIMLSSCTTDRIEIENTGIENSLETQKTEAPTLWYENKIDIFYDPNLSPEEINNTRDYYFHKYHQNHQTIRLSMFNEFRLEPYHEQWIVLKFHIQEHPEGDEPDDEVGHDPRLEMF